MLFFKQDVENYVMLRCFYQNVRKLLGYKQGVIGIGIVLAPVLLCYGLLPQVGLILGKDILCVSYC